MADSKQPIYRKILDVLVAEIQAGRYAPGQKFPSEAALVRRFGASRITVGRAVRELQQRGLVERISGSGTWVQGETKPAGEPLLFGLIIPDLGETEIFEPICQGIADAPEAAGCALLWPHARAGSYGRDHKALQLAQQCIAHKVAGAFFAPVEISPASAETNRRVLQMLDAAHIPVVLLDRRPDHGTRVRYDMVGINNRRAGQLAAEHLVSLGAGRIGFLYFIGQATTASMRAAGYSDAAGSSDRIWGIDPAAMFSIPEAALDCDGFVCSNDRIAGRLMHYLLSRGRSIPRDVRIVGIDDVNYAALLPVPLTTIHQPCREIGETALGVMLERLKRPKAAAKDILLDCELVIRDSCGAGTGTPAS